MKIRVIVAAIATILVFPVLSVAGDVVLIGNPSILKSTLSKKDIQNFFLGKKTVWDDGTKVVFAIRTDTDLHKQFLKKYVDKSTSQFASHWKKLVFTGKGSAPLNCNSDREMIKFVSETKGAIGYVAPGNNLDDVKTISAR